MGQPLVKSNDVPWCWWKERSNQTIWLRHRKTLPDFKERCATQWRVTGNGKFSSLLIQRQTFDLLIYLSVCFVVLLSWTADNSHCFFMDGIQSFVVCGEDCRHLLSQQSPSVDGSSLCSPLSLFQPSVCCGGVVLISHPASNHHIDRLMGRPAGGWLEHTVVLFQASDEQTTFILLRSS